MAASCRSHVLLMIVLAVWQALSLASAARPLNCVVPLPTPSDHELAPALNLALPRLDDTVVVAAIPALHVTELSLSAIVSGEEAGSRLSSGSMASSRSRRRGRSRTFGPLFLNFLPKGSAPPSGPSKGTNSLNN